MRRSMVLLGLLGATPALAGVIVFDPTNFGVNLEQVAHHIELIERMDAQLRNQARALENWEFTRIEEALAAMQRVRGVFDANPAVFGTLDVAADFEARFPLASDHYADLPPDALQTLRHTWLLQQRAALVQARAVQNRAYLQLAPTQERVGAYVTQSNAAPGPTAALQAANELTATLTAQVQALQALEIGDARAALEDLASAQAEAAFHRQRRAALLRDWPTADAGSHP